MALIRFCRRPWPEATNPRRHGNVDVVRQQCSATDDYYFITISLFLFSPCLSIHRFATKIAPPSSSTSKIDRFSSLRRLLRGIRYRALEKCILLPSSSMLSGNQHLALLLKCCTCNLDDSCTRSKYMGTRFEPHAKNSPIRLRLQDTNAG